MFHYLYKASDDYIDYIAEQTTITQLHVQGIKNNYLLTELYHLYCYTLLHFHRFSFEDKI